MSILYRIFISERKIFLLFSAGILAYGLFLYNKIFSIGVYSHFWWKLWLLSIVFLVISFSKISPSSFLKIHKNAVEFLKEFFKLHFQRTGYLIAFLFIIAFGIFFRLYRLDSFVWGLEGFLTDTPFIAGYALRILEGIPYIVIGNTGLDTHDTLPYYYIAMFISLFGAKLFIFRCVALSIAIISVVLTYFVIKSITRSIIVSLAGMALLTFSAVDTVLNYSVYESVMSVPILLSCFLLASLAIKNNRSIHFIIAGLCFGLGLSSSKYFIAYAPAIVLMFIYHAAFSLQRLMSLAKGMVFFFLAMFFVTAPKLIQLTYHHTYYFERAWAVTSADSSFNDGGIISVIGDILSKMKPTFILLFFRTEKLNKLIINNTPIIDQFILPLFFIGIVYAIVKIKDYKCFFLLCCLALTICLNASSYPADYRCIIFMPFLYILVSLAFNLTELNRVSKFKKLLYIPLAMYLIVIFIFNVKIYYDGMGVTPTKALNQYNLSNVMLGKYLSENVLHENVYVCLGKPHYAILFITHDKWQYIDKLTYGIPLRVEWQECKEYWYHKILLNICKITNENEHREGNLLLIFDNAPCNEEVVSRLESVFEKNRSELSIYSKTCKRNFVYSTFELEKDEYVKVKYLLPPNDDEMYPPLKEGPNDKFIGGILGKYYEGINLNKLVSERADKEIDFKWDSDRPHPLLPADDFSVKWEGFIKINKDGEYWLGTLSDDGVRLWIDDQLLIDDWTNQQLEENMTMINLMEGWHTIRLEYYDSGGVATIRFFWENGDGQKFTIPSDHLCCTSQ